MCVWVLFCEGYCFVTGLRPRILLQNVAVYVDVLECSRRVFGMVTPEDSRDC